VSDAFVANDRETGRSRGFGFVTMDPAGGNDAIAELNETDFMGRTIRVNEAQPQGDRPRKYGFLWALKNILRPPTPQIW
jgi:RNA recognition motif-containing protein